MIAIFTFPGCNKLLRKPSLARFVCCQHHQLGYNLYVHIIPFLTHFLFKYDRENKLIKLVHHSAKQRPFTTDDLLIIDDPFKRNNAYQSLFLVESKLLFEQHNVSSKNIWWSPSCSRGYRGLVSRNVAQKPWRDFFEVAGCLSWSLHIWSEDCTSPLMAPFSTSTHPCCQLADKRIRRVLSCRRRNDLDVMLWIKRSHLNVSPRRKFIAGEAVDSFVSSTKTCVEFFITCCWQTIQWTWSAFLFIS